MPSVCLFDIGGICIVTITMCKEDVLKSWQWLITVSRPSDIIVLVFSFFLFCLCFLLCYWQGVEELVHYFCDKAWYSTTLDFFPDLSFCVFTIVLPFCMVHADHICACSCLVFFHIYKKVFNEIENILGWEMCWCITMRILPNSKRILTAYCPTHQFHSKVFE